MNKPESAADFLARQAAERGDDDEDLVATARSRVTLAAGALKVELADVAAGGKPDPADLSFMLSGLDEATAELMATGFALVCRGVGRGSASTLRSQLLAGVASWPMKPGRKVSADRIDTAWLKRFKAKLDDERGGLTENYRKEIIEAFQQLLTRLQRHPETAGRLAPGLRTLTNLYPGHTERIQHTEIIKDLSFDDIVDAALVECIDAIGRFEAAKARMAALDLEPPTLERAAGDPVALAWHLRREHAGLLPPYREKRASGRFRRLVDSGTYRDAERVLFPTDRELLPFTVALSAIYGLNPSVVLGMTVDDWEERRLHGKHRLRLFPNKPRAGRRQRFEIAVTDDPDHPLRLLTFLRERTQPLRDAEPARCGRLLFVRLGRMPTEARQMDLNSKNHRDALAGFIADNRLTDFNLKQLRPTAMDRVHEITGDIVLTQAFANHASLATTERDYPSRGRRLRNQQRLGRAMRLRHRDIETGWRNPSYELPHDVDKTAATPGFGCRNPYLGEIETEEFGSLCAAYGHCPGCELATVDFGSARACAYLNELRVRIDEAQSVVGAQAWIARWRPIKTELLLKIGRFPRSVRAAAAHEIITTLPPVE